MVWAVPVVVVAIQHAVGIDLEHAAGRIINNRKIHFLADRNGLVRSGAVRAE